MSNSSIARSFCQDFMQRLDDLIWSLLVRQMATLGNSMHPRVWQERGHGRTRGRRHDQVMFAPDDRGRRLETRQACAKEIRTHGLVDRQPAQRREKRAALAGAPDARPNALAQKGAVGWRQAGE